MIWAALLLAAAPPAGAQRTGSELQVEAGASRIYVVTHRTGLLSFLGHEHAILAGKWNARICWDPPAHTGSFARFDVDARALDIDADSARALAGLGKGPSPSQRAQIQRKLHGDQGLATQQFPELRFESHAVGATANNTLVVHGRLTIREVTRDVELPVTVQQDDAGILTLVGKLTVQQRSFGIRPESIAGVVKVADPVDLHVRLVGTPLRTGC